MEGKDWRDGALHWEELIPRVLCAIPFKLLALQKTDFADV